MARRMKDSGVAWIGQVPTGWSVVKSKVLFSTGKNVVGTESDQYERLALTLKGVIKRSKDADQGLQPADFDSYQILRENELVFKLIDLQNVSTSRVGLSPYVGIVSPAYVILRHKDIALPQFYYFYFYSLWQRQIFNQLGDAGVRSSLTASDLLELKTMLPPLAEQKQIAEFLDRECGKLDALVEKVKAQIAQLEACKKSIITEAVTKGVRGGKRKLKDSDVEWIGQVPAGWSVERIASLYNVRNEKCSDKEYGALSVTMQGVVPQLEDVAKTDDGDNRKLVRIGDFVINSRSDRRGACGISQYDGSVSLINTVLRPFGIMNSGYYSWLFRSFAFADEFYANGHGIVDDLWTTRWQDMKRIKVPSPSLAEQKQIAEYLDKKCGTIDGLIKKSKEQLEKLAEYKKSLIYEYVTGKKEVSA